MLVQGWLTSSASRFPDKVALVCEGRRLSYADLEQRSRRLAAGLVAAGVKPRDRVAIFLENSVEAVVAVFGTLHAGAVFSMINPSTKVEKLAFMLQDERPQALVASGAEPRGTVAAEAARQASIPLVVWLGTSRQDAPPSDQVWRDFEDLAAQDGIPAIEESVTEEDLATIIYTSGSTGRPKGVMSTHANVTFAATSISSYLGIVAEDRILCALPLAFDYGLYQLIMVVRAGATLVLEKNFVFPVKALEIMEREHVTGFPGVPTMFALLLSLKDIRRFDLSSLRFITNTAAALPVSHIAAVREALPHATLFSMYGLTECKRVSYLPPEELDRRPGSVGVAIPGTRVEIVDDEGRALPHGRVGELIVHGPHVMLGYWERPEETARRFRRDPRSGERVLYTGDLFRADSDGYLYFVGRRDDMLKCRGEKVSPKEIEDAVAAMEGVLEVAVLGVPDAVLGDAICLFVVPKPEAAISAGAIRAYCAAHLEDYMMPKQIQVVESLPKSGNGKVDKEQLRTCAALPAG